MDISYVFSNCKMTQIKQQTVLEVFKTKLMVLFGHIFARVKRGCWNLEEVGNETKRLRITAPERSVPSCSSCLLQPCVKEGQWRWYSLATRTTLWLHLLH